MELTAPEPLGDHHMLEGFSCGEPILDTWLMARARKNERDGASRTYVVCDGNTVVAYYCVATGAVAHAQTTGKIRRNMPDPIPVMVLGRLAVSANLAGQGVGTALLRDAILRTWNAAEIAGIRALLAHALNETAAKFYERSDFTRSPTDPLVMLLPLSAVRATLSTSAGTV